MGKENENPKVTKESGPFEDSNSSVLHASSSYKPSMENVLPSTPQMQMVPNTSHMPQTFPQTSSMHQYYHPSPQMYPQYQQVPQMQYVPHTPMMNHYYLQTSYQHWPGTFQPYVALKYCVELSVEDRRTKQFLGNTHTLTK